MNPLNEIHRAYQVLGLDPGLPFSTVMTRYKRLAKTWHPDRAYTPSDKEFHNEELKKINNAKDVLTAHFEGGDHKEQGNCECRGSSSESGESEKSEYAGPGPGPRKYSGKPTTDDLDDDEFDEPPQTKEEAEAAFARAKAEAQEAAKSAEEDRKSQALRWKISIGIAIVAVLVCTVPFVIRALREPILRGQDSMYGDNETNEELSKRSNDWARCILEKQRVAQAILHRVVSTDEASNWTAPYISLDLTASSLSREIATKEKSDSEQKRREQTTQNTLTEAKQMQEDPKSRTAEFLRERLQKEESRQKELMQIIQGGQATTEQNREEAHIGQLINMDKAELRNRGEVVP